MSERGTESLYRTLVESSACGLFVFQDGRFRSVNPAGEAITGYSQQELVEMDLWTLIHPDFQEAVRHRVSRWRATVSAPETCEICIRAKGGVEKWVEVVATPAQYESRPAVVGTVLDITERKRLEPRAHQSHKMEALGRLAGGVAHDFNNLLTVIAGYGQMLLNRLDARSPLRSDVEEILKGAARAAALTGQLLAFSRHQHAQPRVLDLNALVSNTLKMLRRVISEDITLKTELHPAIGNIKADQGQIEQVLMNLAVNARDAMPEGGVLTIGTSEMEIGQPPLTSSLRAGSYVVLSVSDTGRGMNAQTQSHLFEPFFTTKEMGKGTGLGLSTVYGIVRQSGGDIWVQSAPGAGSTFKVVLPSLATEAKAVDGASPAARLVRSASRECILVVEDDPVLRRLLTEALGKQDYRVLEAESGEAALRLVRNGKCRIDLLLTDVVMPGMSGGQLAKRLTHGRRDLPVLYITGYAEGEQLAAEAALLRKPFTLSELTSKVRELLQNTPKVRRAGG